MPGGRLGRVESDSTGQVAAASEIGLVAVYHGKSMAVQTRVVLNTSMRHE